MTDLANNPAVIKLLEYAKKKRTIGLDDLNDLLPEDLMSPENMPDILDTLETAGIQIKAEETAEHAKEAGEGEFTAEEEVLIDEEDGADDSRLRQDDIFSEVYEAGREGAKPEPERRFIKTAAEAGVDDPIKLYLQEIGK